MKLSSAVKSITWLKANASAALLELARRREPVIITQNGEAKAVLQDVRDWEETRATLALLKILAQSRKSAGQGRVRPLAEAMRRVRARTRRPGR